MDYEAELIEEIKDIIQILIILLVIGTFLAFNIADTHNYDIIHIDQDYTKSRILKWSKNFSFLAIFGHIILVTVVYYPPTNYVQFTFICKITCDLLILITIYKANERTK